MKTPESLSSTLPFNNVAIVNNVVISGTFLSDTIVVNGGSVNASGWVLGGNWNSFDRIILNGGGGDDAIIGSSASDTLSGGLGADSLDGGAGGDTVSYASAAAGVGVDLLAGAGSFGEADGDLLFNIEHLTGSDFNDLLGGNDASNFLFGGGGSDNLSGGADSDQLYGGDSSDTLKGGGGADVINGEAGFDLVSYDGAADSVILSLATGTGAGDIAEGDSLSGIEALAGGNYGDTLTGNAEYNEIYGASGSDTITDGGANFIGAGDGDDTVINTFVSGGYWNGGAGIDTLDLSSNNFNAAISLGFGGFTALGAEFQNFENVIGTRGSDTIQGGERDNRLNGHTGADTIFGWNGHDTLEGGAGNDFLYGGNGDDLLDGGAGDEWLEGGWGNDTYVANSAHEVLSILEYSFQGVDTLTTNVGSAALSVHLENLTFTGSGSFFGSGNSLDNRLTAGAGADTLDGGAGSDWLTGGAGGDTASYAGSLQAVSVSLDGSVAGAGDALEDIITGVEHLDGSNHRDRLYGNAGANVLNGLLGHDNLSGGLGSDTYYLDTSADVVNELAKAGFDTMFSRSGNTIARNVERLYLRRAAIVLRADATDKMISSPETRAPMTSAGSQATTSSAAGLATTR